MNLFGMVQNEIAARPGWYVVTPSFAEASLTGVSVKGTKLTAGQRVSIIQCGHWNQPKTGWAFCESSNALPSVLELNQSRSGIIESNRAGATLAYMLSQAGRMITEYRAARVTAITATGLTVVDWFDGSARGTIPVSTDLTPGQFTVGDGVLIRELPLRQVVGWWDTTSSEFSWWTREGAPEMYRQYTADGATGKAFKYPSGGDAGLAVFDNGTKIYMVGNEADGGFYWLPSGVPTYQEPTAVPWSEDIRIFGNQGLLSPYMLAWRRPQWSPLYESVVASLKTGSVFSVPQRHTNPVHSGFFKACIEADNGNIILVEVISTTSIGISAITPSGGVVDFHLQSITNPSGSEVVISGAFQGAGLFSLIITCGGSTVWSEGACSISGVVGVLSEVASVANAYKDDAIEAVYGYPINTTNRVAMAYPGNKILFKKTDGLYSMDRAGTVKLVFLGNTIPIFGQGRPGDLTPSTGAPP